MGQIVSELSIFIGDAAGLRRLFTESKATIPPFGPIERNKCSTRFPANESPRRTGLHSFLSAKSSFYLPALEISRSCRTASGRFCMVYMCTKRNQVRLTHVRTHYTSPSTSFTHLVRKSHADNDTTNLVCFLTTIAFTLKQRYYM
jgi:hypothetical protein